MNERTVFVSYSRKDSERVQHAVSLLEAGGAQVFRDLDDIQFGDRWETVIREKLAEAERVLVFWSEHAKASEWVTKEWEIAVDLGKRLVPVLLDETPMPPALGQFHALTNFMAAAKPEPVKSLNPKVKYAVLGIGALSAGVMATILFVPFSQEQMAEAPSASEPTISSAPGSTPEPALSSEAPPPPPTTARAPVSTAPKPAAAPRPNASVTGTYSVDTPVVDNGTDTAATMPAPSDALTVKERQQLGGLAMGTILVGLAILMYWFKRRRQRVKAAQAPEAMVATAYDSPDEFVEQVFTEYK